MQNYNQSLNNQGLEKLKNIKSNEDKNQLSEIKNIAENYDKFSNKENAEDEKLKLLANEFTSILLKQMFKSMRNTIPEDSLISGGFSEDVFTDMLDGEISKSGAEQKDFSSLGKLLYNQLQKR